MTLAALSWGLTSQVPGQAIAAWGARAVPSDRGFDVVWDRQSAVGDEDLRRALCRKIDQLMPQLRAGFVDEVRVVEPGAVITLHRDRDVVVVAKASAGYVFLAAWALPSFRIGGDIGS